MQKPKAERNHKNVLRKRSLESEANYKDGFIAGFYKLYYPNSQLELMYTIKEGEKVGDFLHYDQQGHKLLEGHFMNARLHGDNIGLLCGWHPAP
jgi:antitoxin component YwqK of YwqJK toxin-antitoxin module